MIRGMAGMTPTMVPAPDPSRTGDILIVKGQPSGCPFLYAFVRHRPGGGLGGKRLCRTLACPDFCLRQGIHRPGKQREKAIVKNFLKFFSGNFSGGCRKM